MIDNALIGDYRDALMGLGNKVRFEMGEPLSEICRWWGWMIPMVEIKVKMVFFHSCILNGKLKGRWKWICERKIFYRELRETIFRYYNCCFNKNG